MEFFPYPARPFQDVARALVEEASDRGGHLVLEMPTGSGKTVVLLAGALAAAKRTGKRVLYVTRTNSQQEQAIREFNQIRQTTGLPFRAFALQGRGRLCLKLEETKDPEWEDANPEELSHFCSAAKNATDRDPQSPKACRFWAGLQRMSRDELLARVGDEAHTAEWLRAAAFEGGFCPYEATKKLLLGADLVVAPYLFAIDPGLSQRLFEWWGTRPEDVILLVDEAHNVPEYLRSLGSPRLSAETVRRALRESEELGHPEVAPKIHARAVLAALEVAVEELVTTYCADEDGFLPPFELEGKLLERFATTTATLRQAAITLEQFGATIKDRRRLLGRIPRSYLGRVASFLLGWLESDVEGYVKLVVRNPNPHLEAYLVDSSRAAGVFQSFHATIHVSGTLDPLQEHRDALGLPDEARLERFPSPFPVDRLKVRVVEGVTTRFEALRADPSAVDALQTATRRAAAAVAVNGACFFPSHRMMAEFQEVGVFDDLRASALYEARGVDQAGLMRLVSQHRTSTSASLLVGVLGGRISEGLDFPGKQLEAMLIVGVPYPRPTARQRALFQFFEIRFSRGWEYAVRAPTIRRLRQALGRLIRSETDRGFAVILDERAAPLLRSAGVDAESGPLDRVLTEFADWQVESEAETA